MLIKCPECKEEISSNAKICPKCGENLVDGLAIYFEKISGTFMGLLLVIVIAIGINGIFEETDFVNENNQTLIMIIAFSSSILIIGNLMSKIVKKYGRKFEKVDGGVYDYSGERVIKKLNKIAIPLIAIMIIAVIVIKLSEPAQKTQSTIGIGSTIKNH